MIKYEKVEATRECVRLSVIVLEFRLNDHFYFEGCTRHIYFSSRLNIATVVCTNSLVLHMVLSHDIFWWSREVSTQKLTGSCRRSFGYASILAINWP
jgi:hypothetical protein